MDKLFNKEEYALLRQASVDSIEHQKQLIILVDKMEKFSDEGKASEAFGVFLELAQLAFEQQHKTSALDKLKERIDARGK